MKLSKNISFDINRTTGLLFLYVTRCFFSVHVPKKQYSTIEIIFVVNSSGILTNEDTHMTANILFQLYVKAPFSCFFACRK